MIDGDMDDSYPYAGAISLRTLGNTVMRPFSSSAALKFSDFRGRMYRGPSANLVFGFDATLRPPVAASTTSTMWECVSGKGPRCAGNVIVAAQQDTDGHRFVYINNNLFTVSTTGVWGNGGGWSINTEHTLVIWVKPEVNLYGHLIHFYATDNATRMLSLHCPWIGNGHVYYDVRGCCGGNQRLNGPMHNASNKTFMAFRTQQHGFPNRQIYRDGFWLYTSGTNTTSTSFTWGTKRELFQNWRGRVYCIYLFNCALSNEEIDRFYFTT